jgi:hypothetical protein
MAKGRQPGLLSGLSLQTLLRAYSAPESELSAEEAASTLFRFFRSRHVADLRLIVVTILVLLALYILVVFAALVGFEWQTAKPELYVTFIGPSVGIAGVVISWAYKSASTRLGIIDLFACEIATLCRVGTIFDIGTYYSRLYENPPAPPTGSTDKRAPDEYVSKEDYFPIFDHNSSDLQLLEALVVAPITEFYTYMKATRDTQRQLAAIGPSQATAPPQAETTDVMRTPWQDTMLNVVYMIFLGYESGRKVIEQLIEFEPSAAENKMVILITELTCYGFLLKHLKQDPRYPRLRLRGDIYRELAPTLYHEIAASHGQNEDYWRPAKELLPQLKERYERALHHSVDPASGEREAR